MSKITKISKDSNTQRVWVYIDYRLCTSIRLNVWEIMNLKEGEEITRAQLLQREKEVWHKAKKTNISSSGKQAMIRVIQWISKYLPNLDAKVIDFKFASIDRDSFSNSSITRQDQNICLFTKGSKASIITLEVAFSEIQRGTNYWVNADKVKYAQSNDNRDGWVVLYYKFPVEKFVWIKPRSDIKYQQEEIIKGSKNYYIVFNKNGPEIYSSIKFSEYLRNKIGHLIPEVSSDNITANSSNTFLNTNYLQTLSKKQTYKNELMKHSKK